MKPITRSVLLAALTSLCLIGCGQSAPRPTLSQAIERGDLKGVQHYLEAKTDLSRTNSSGWAPLHLAAMKGDLAIVQALVEAGALPNQPGGEGKTPLDLAREKGQTQVVDFLQGGGSRKSGGRGLIDGGLGVSEAMDNM